MDHALAGFLTSVGRVNIDECLPVLIRAIVLRFPRKVLKE